jgi:hypothetical protein
VITPVSRLIALVLVAGCAQTATTSHSSVAASTHRAAAPAEAPASAPQSPGALAQLASQPLVVFPVQMMRNAVPAWSDKLGDQRAYLSSVDDEIAFAARERRFRGKWAYPADLARASRRNPTYAADPYTIAIDPLGPVEKDPSKIIGEPLAGQMRALAALFDARYALLPVELRFAPDSMGGRATLHLVIIDARQAKLLWKGDVSGDAVASFSPAVGADLAGRVADLFTVPR